MADEEDGDEDVDLEHSALYKYMQELGLVERTQPAHVNEEACRTASIWMRILDTFWKVPSMLLSYLHSELLVNSTLNALVERFNDEHRKVICNSRALTEDDANFLENLLDPLVQPSSTILPPTRTYLGGNLKNVFVPATVLLAYFCAKFQTGFSITIVECISITALSSYMMLKLSKHLLVWRKNKTLLKSLTHVTELVHECEVFLKSARKCLNYIQEIEVIGRGLILTTAGTSVSKMEHSMLFPHLQSLPSACLCTPLRLCLFSSIMERFGTTKTATMQLIKSYPLRKEIDNGHYIANMTDEELGVCLTSNVNEENLSIANDGLSVSAIKDMGQLFGVQLSEFLRRLALCFYPEFVAVPYSLHTKDCFTIIPPIIKSLCLSMKNDSKLLNDCVQFHQKMTREKKSSFPKENASVIQSVMSSQRALVTATRSLALHLKVSIARVEDFTESLENADDVCSCPEANHSNEHRLNTDLYSSLNDQLELIKQDLHACNLCWEESSLRLQKLGPNQENCGNLQIPELESRENPTDCQSGIPLLEKTDIAPEDQIFEAYVDDTEEPNTDEDCYWYLELRKKSAEERNISKRMFTELKTVLVPKVEEWHKREACALRVGDITEQISASPTTINKQLFEESLKQPSEDLSPISNQNSAEDVRSKIPHIEAMMPSFSVLNSSIASMAAARSKLLKSSPCETFDSVGDDYCDSDTSSDT